MVAVAARSVFDGTMRNVTEEVDFELYFNETWKDVELVRKGKKLEPIHWDDENGPIKNVAIVSIRKDSCENKDAKSMSSYETTNIAGLKAVGNNKG